MTTMRDEADLLYAMADSLERLAQTRELVAPSTFGERLAQAVRQAGGVFTAGTCRVDVDGRLDVGLRAETESGTASTLLGVAQPEIRQFLRPFPLRGLCEVLPTSTYSTPFVRELSPLSASPAASGVAETASAVDVSSVVSFTPDSVEPGLLTADVTVTQQLADDTPAFARWLNARLPAEVSNREEFAFVQGNGEVVNAGIVGFVNDANVPSRTGQASLQAAISTAAGVVGDSGAVPVAAAVHPSDLFTALLAVPTFFDALEDHLMVVPTLGVPKGTTVVGAWGAASVIVDRQTAAVEVFTQHLDYRAKGLALVQCTSRVGFEITQPWAFCVARGF